MRNAPSAALPGAPIPLSRGDSSVHGRRCAIFGYSENALEAWAYPVQILASFSVGFRQQGATTEIPGQTVLRRIIYSPEAVTRIYAGPDFIVREKLFVPLDVPADAHAWRGIVRLEPMREAWTVAGCRRRLHARSAGAHGALPGSPHSAPGHYE